MNSDDEVKFNSITNFDTHLSKPSPEQNYNQY